MNMNQNIATISDSFFCSLHQNLLHTSDQTVRGPTCLMSHNQYPDQNWHWSPPIPGQQNTGNARPTGHGTGYAQPRPRQVMGALRDPLGPAPMDVDQVPLGRGRGRIVRTRSQEDMLEAARILISIPAIEAHRQQQRIALQNALRNQTAMPGNSGRGRGVQRQLGPGVGARLPQRMTRSLPGRNYRSLSCPPTTRADRAFLYHYRNASLVARSMVYLT